ncbi:hypothetical protein GGX14DRAFT_537060 [Mycena pura]|uniref:Uncharacterized protein n=1 Tax=Mycena pura TaxID=153505 RepID=A0AAD6UXM5_9AGAR|nr:hypothetical protein GGX14DRAFT_537060 [Mycena pura]
MAALATSVPISQLCDYCHQKPKHGTHPYCSKTCAAQIATLCNQCHQKPKYQNFDFCGKNCAATAAATAKTPGNRAAKAAPQTSSPSNPAGTTSGQAPSSQAPTNSIIDPIQLAKLVVQHIPQVQNFLAAVAPTQPSGPPPVRAPATAPAPAPNPTPAATTLRPRNNPFLNSTKQAAPPAVAVAVSPGPAAPNGGPPVLDCLIPDCGQPVHVDSSGNMSDYCSKKHREEAVSSGLVSPCIMCLALPQSDTDYFCGRECREEALNKTLQP